MYDIDLVNIILQSAFAHDIQAPHQVSWCVGAISYNLRSHLVFLQGKVKSVCYIAQVNPMLLSFIRQEGDLHF